MRILGIFLAAALGATITVHAYSRVEAAERKVRQNTAAAKKAGWDVNRYVVGFEKTFQKKTVRKKKTIRKK